MTLNDCITLVEAVLVINLLFWALVGCIHFLAMRLGFFLCTPLVYSYNKPKLHVLSSMYYCFRVIYGSKAGIKVGKWFKRRPTVRNVFTSIRIQSDKVILFHVHDILYS